jgi:hypothetical protein
MKLRFISWEEKKRARYFSFTRLIDFYFLRLIYFHISRFRFVWPWQRTGFCASRKKNKIKTYIKICLFRLADSGHNFLIPPSFLSFLVSLLVYKVRRSISKKKVRRWGQDTEGAVCLSKVRRSRSLSPLPRSVCILCVYDYCCSLLGLERKVLACVHF